MDVSIFVLWVLMALPIVAVLMALTLLTPSWHWVVGFIILIGGALTCLWIQHWMAASAPGYKEGPGGGLGIIIIGGWSIAFVIASASYIAGLAWWHSRN